MNSFLHRLDVELEKEMVREDGTRFFFYERYADDMLFGIEDMLFGIEKGEGSKEGLRLFRKLF